MARVSLVQGDDRKLNFRKALELMISQKVAKAMAS